MPRIRQYSIRDFSRGMASNPDPADIAANAAMLVRNADLSQFPGSLSKATGVSRYDFGGMLPGGLLPENEEIMSLGVFTYNKVWDGNQRVNKKYEMAVFQFKGDHDFDWYETEREVGTENWSEALKYHCGYQFDDPLPGWQKVYSSAFEGAWGVSNDHDQAARWNAFNGVLRAAMGSHILLADQQQPNHPMENKSDSFPLQWRYVNRSPQHAIYGADGLSNGYFKVFDILDPHYLDCLIGDNQTGICRSVGLPKCDLSGFITRLSPPNQPGESFHCWDGFGYVPYPFNTQATARYLILPIYDGHQVGFPQSEATSERIYVATSPTIVPYNSTNKFNITMTYTPSPLSFPKRLSGIKLYRSLNTTAPIYHETLYVDIRDGVQRILSGDGIVYNDTGTIQYIRAMIPFSAAWHEAFAVFAADLFNNMFIRIFNDDNTWAEFKITDTIWADYPQADGYHWLYLYFDSGTHPVSITETHRFEINSRWYEVPGAPTQVRITILDPNQSIPAPPWLDANINVSDLSSSDCNYGHMEIFKDRAWLTDIAYDDEKQRTMARYSNPSNHPFAGLDLAPNYLIPPIGDESDLVGVRNHLDFLLVCTNRGFFKYLVTAEGVDAIAELIWDSGLETIDAYQETDGISYFMGRRGGQTWAYVWNPAGKPEPLLHVRSVIEGFLSAGAQVKDIKVVPLLGENNVLFSFPVIS